jgi:hypothetical protein
MLLKKPNIVTFTRAQDGVTIDVAEPSAMQLYQALALEPANAEARAAETRVGASIRERKQLLILLAPLCPAGWHPVEWFTWWRARRRMARWLRPFTISGLKTIMRTVLLSAYGVDVDNLDAMAQFLAEKKTTQPVMKSSPDSAI